MLNILLSLLLLVSASINGEGFCAGTLVKTPGGYTKIEDLRINDHVICYDLKGACVERPITHIKKEKSTACLEMWVGKDVDHGQPLYCDPDQKFYLPQENKWLPATDILINKILLSNCTEFRQVLDISYIPVIEDVYDISVADYHNFCVTTEDIHVHNFFPLVLGITWVIGEGIAVYGGVAILGVATVGIINEVAKEGRRSRPTASFDADAFGQQFASAGGSGGGPRKPGGGSSSQSPQNPQDPNDPNNKKDSELKSKIKNMGKNIEEHLKKLEDYKKNPDAFDNKGDLARAGNNAARRADIINGRVKHLTKEITDWTTQVNAAKDVLTKRGVKW